MDVRELTKLYQSGDMEAGWQLVLSQDNLLKRLTINLGLDPSVEVDDVVSELRIALLRSLKYYDPERLELPGFVVMMFWRRALRIVDKLTSMPSIPITDVCVYAEQDNSADEKETLLAVADAINKVHPLHREVFLMWADNELPDTIASHANRTVGRDAYNTKSVKLLIADSVAAVRSVLEKEIQDLT